MGSASSKFKKYIENGDEYAAMQIYQSSPELKKVFDPNLSYGENRHHNTAMHYAARHGMKHLLRTFLTELGGDPNKRNVFDETVLHSACGVNVVQPANSHISISCVRLTGPRGSAPAAVGSGSGSSHPNATLLGNPVLAASAQERRAACVALLLQWRGTTLAKGEDRDRIHLDAVDRDGNTALHLAASAGLAGSIRLLLAAGIRTLTVDARGRTAARRALDGGHARLAALLERSMLASDESVEWCSSRWCWTPIEVAEQEAEEALSAGAPGLDTHEGLRPQELRESKDRLLVDTSDMLRVPLFTAEALLRENEWMKEVLVEKWMKDPAACCQAAGVPLPGGSLDSEHPEEGMGALGEQKTIECGICCEEVAVVDAGGGPCGHWYCVSCWSRYLSGRVKEGDARPACPAPKCPRAAPPSLLQRCLTPDTQRKYLVFDIKAFVESSRGMKWCPIAGCGRAVRLFEQELSLPNIQTSTEDTKEFVNGYPPVSRGVDCGDFHFFCWDCHGEPHAPLGCASWSRWLARAGSTVSVTPLSAAATGAESAASSLWLLAHCKPCPSCSCPIQKNDGCNHMKCTKCKFDFCWVCLESWKRHGSATGGYFRCTRDEAVQKAEQSRGQAIFEARIQNVEAQEQWRFAVLCARYRRHEQKWAEERELIIATPVKIKALDPTGTGGGVLEAAARELALSRRVLAGACAYTFMLSQASQHKAAFHYAQEELERCVLRLSTLVAREVVEAPWAVIKRATAPTRRWRMAMLRLARPPAPPNTLSAQELRVMARLLSRGRLDHRDPWRFPLGPRGEPLKVPEPLDPDIAIFSVMESQLPIPAGVGDRLSGALDNDVYRINVSEYNMDLIIALEMSRLQMLEEQARRNMENDMNNTSQPSSRDVTLTRRQRPARLNISVSIGATSDNEEKLSLSDDQLKLAIQLSLQDPVGEPIQDNDGGPSGQVQGTPRGGESPMSDQEPRTSGLTKQEESWSRAADITVGYFLKALGGAPLDLPNLALGLDLLTHRQERNNRELCRQEEINEDDSVSSHRNDQLPVGGGSGTSSFMEYCQEGNNRRPPLVRSGGMCPSRPPLLRQMGGRVRRSWSMGDISLGSSSTDDTNATYCKIPDDFSNGAEEDNLHQERNNKMSINAATLPHPPKTTLKLSNGDNTQYTITKSIQIDAFTQQCDFDYDIVKTTRSPTIKQDPYRLGFGGETSKNFKDNVTRKRLQCMPKNLPWGEFCCEKKCVKTGLTENQSPTKYNERKERVKPSVINEKEPPKTVKVDYRGKVKNTQVFNFNDKTIHIPDLNSSHLKVNTYLTKMAINNKNTGPPVLDKPMQFLNQNDILGDNFRRHSDHIPRVDRGAMKVKSCSSEKHISDRNNVTCIVKMSPEKTRSRSEADSSSRSHSESPKKLVKLSTKQPKNIPKLSIKICNDLQDPNLKSPENVTTNTKTKRGLETDSSNECESETGIPKSPTLYISGVSICRETSPKSTLSTTTLANSDSNVSRSNSTSSQYFSRTSSFRLPSEQKSPKTKQKIAWKDLDEVATVMPTSPVIVRVTSPSLSPCSERNTIETMTTSTYTTESPELYTPSLLRSNTPPAPRDCPLNCMSNESLNILDVPMLPPSHFSDDVFVDDDDPGLMIDCSNENKNLSTSLHCSLRGTVYTGCHSGGIMISNMALGSTLKDCSVSSINSKCSSDYNTSPSKEQEALYENIYPKTSINSQAFDMSLPNSPKSLASVSGPLQKSWSARPLITLQDFTEEAIASMKLKSKSANEPERDREVFHFPKSSTDGALSSVLHVQESNLSSDDFHEALFLLERSPKTRDSKRRKRSKKREKDKSGDRESKKEAQIERKSEPKQKEMPCCGESSKQMDNINVDDKTSCCVVENDSPSAEQDEVSSAL